jgi:glycosyltransferase involved in cell wall biosynthesis
MKKVLLLTRPICPPWDEGSKNFAYTLAKYAGDFEIHLLTCKKVADLSENVVQHDIFSSSRLDLKQKYNLFKFLRKAKDLDIIHSLFTPTLINSFFLRKALKNKKVKLIQTVATLREDLYKERDFKKILFGDLIVTYSDYAKKKLNKLGFDNVKRIYPGIDIEKYSPAPKNRELLKRYKTNEDDFVINYTGEFVRLGDIDDVIDSFIDLTRFVIPGLTGDPENYDSQKSLDPRFRGDDIKRRFILHLAVRVKNQKDAKKKNEIEEKLKKAGCLDRVAFIYDQNYEMQDIYNLCDVSIFPARTMAGKFDIPLAVIEAMSCGKPVIASNLDRLKHFLNESNSILIDPGDREALKDKILYLYKNTETRKELGEKGMKFVRDNFDIIKVVKEYEEVYSVTASEAK